MHFHCSPYRSLQKFRCLPGKMTRPLLELADIIRAAGQRLIDRHPAWLTWLHIKVLVAIERCRTAALGGHIDECSRCGHRATSYNSCLMESIF